LTFSLQRCDLPNTTETELNKAACEGQNEAGFYRLEHGNNCSSFVRCVFDGSNLIGGYFTCPTPLYFDTDRCVWPEERNTEQVCTSDKLPITPEQRDALDEYIVTDHVRQSAAEAKWACSGEDGLIRSKQLCHRYYQCESGRAYSFDCETQVVAFDQITKKCVERNQLNADDPCSF